jgi:hypothetical protein
MAQQPGRIGNHDAVNNWTPSVATTTIASVAEGRQIAEEIINVVGLKANFEVMESRQVPNAAAVAYGGKRFVLYNGNFINNLIRTTGTKWAAISVLAHEIGHHLNGHTISGGSSQPAIELEADEFSGFVLRKMGASLTEAQAAMKTIAGARASRTHPAQYDRLVSIEKGWNQADAQVTGRKDVAKITTPKPAPQPEETVTVQRPVISNANVIGAISFKGDPHSSYYVTSGYNVVKVKNNQLTVIGKLARVNNSTYPYMIYDESTKLYVHASGAIVNSNGRSIGTLSAVNG